MPNRLDRTKQLLKRLAVGPSFWLKPSMTPDLVSRQIYQIWFDTWILPEISTLIPEFRQMTETEIYKLVDDARSQ